MKVIQSRIYGTLDANQGEGQAGFRKDYSTIDHIFTLDQLIEKTKEYNIDVHLLFIDFSKAFDSVSHNYMWQTLVNQGIPKKWIQTIMEIYRDAKAYVKTAVEGQKSK